MFITETINVSKVEVDVHNRSNELHIWVDGGQQFMKDVPWDRHEWADGHGTLWWATDGTWWQFANAPLFLDGKCDVGYGGIMLHQITDRRSNQKVDVLGCWSSRAGVVNLVINAKLVEVLVHIKGSGPNSACCFAHMDGTMVQHILDAFDMPYKVALEPRYCAKLFEDQDRMLDRRDLHPEHVGADRELAYGIINK